MDKLVALLTVPAWLAYMIGSPATFMLEGVDTWRSAMPVWEKLLVNATLDVILAAIWPITWCLWGVERLMGHHTPLDLLF